jgi:hypothetical protein
LPPAPRISEAARVVSGWPLATWAESGEDTPAFCPRPRWM